MRVADLTWMQVEKYLETDDRCALPLGGDGSFGGYYEKPSDEMAAIWRIAVEETRLVLTDGG